MDLAALGACIEAIDQRTREMDERQQRIEDAVRTPSLTIKDICTEYLHRSETWLRTRPWALPEPDIKGRPNVWWRTTCDEFYSVPIETRRHEYLRNHRTRRAS